MQTTAIVTDLLGPRSLRVGRARRFGGLTLMPVFHDGAALEYLRFSDAHRRGLVAITEVGEQGTVPELLLDNSAPLPVLVLEGEVLLGMKQTRVLNVSVLAPARSRVVVPVSCVEMGRWHSVSAASLGADESSLSPKVRRAKTFSVQRALRKFGHYRSDQSEVWAEVSERLAAHAVSAPTASFADITGVRRHEIERVVARTSPAPGQRGVIAAVEGELCLDLFDRPETLASAWRELVGSYAADALVGSGETRRLGAGDACRWLAALAASETSVHPGVGLGSTVALSSSAGTLSALVHDGAVPHLAAFSQGWRSRS